MGACQGAPSEEDRRNREVNNRQDKDAKKDERKVKLLVLGAGDSGKTTLRKQMSNLYGKGFNTIDQKEKEAVVILDNLVENTLLILEAHEELGVGDPVEDPTSLKAIETLKSMETGVTGLGGKSSFTAEERELACHLFNDEAFKSIVALRAQFHVQDCWFTFRDALLENDDFLTENWLPSEQDCVQSRSRTTGVIEEAFVYRKVRFSIFDAGGQRAGRRKWIHFFENVTALIFVVATSEYDQNLYEDDAVNRLEESLVLFKEICNSKYFVGIPILLFFNKDDIFRQKLCEREIPLNVSGLFPDAPSGNDHAQAIEWLKERFMAQRDKGSPNESGDIYVHVTTAVNAENVNSVFEDVQEIVLRRNLDELMN